MIADSALAAGRAAAVSRVLWITLGLNALAAAVKLGAAFTSGSLALEAGGIDSAFDGIANIAALVAMRAAARPADDDHPYGHRKFETLTAVIIAGLIFVTCGRLAYIAFGSLIGYLIEASTSQVVMNIRPIEVNSVALAAPVAALVINFFTARYERRQGVALGSELLKADASHTRADAFVSLSLLFGLLAVKAGAPIVDPLLGLGIAAFVARVGWGIARDTWAVLADAAVLDPRDLTRVAETVPGVEGTHKIRSRGAPGAVSVDLHVQVDPQLGIGRAHAIGHAVQDRLLEHFDDVTEVVVHVEPEWSLAGDDIARAVRLVVADFAVEAHEIYVHVRPDGRTEVGLHLELDPTLSLRAAHNVADKIEAAVLVGIADVDRVVTHLEPLHAAVQPAAPAEDVRDWPELVARAAGKIDGLSDAHDIEAVRVGAGIRLSAHVRADGRLPLAGAHALAEELELALRAETPELERVTIHVEPR